MKLESSSWPEPICLRWQPIAGLRSTQQPIGRDLRLRMSASLKPPEGYLARGFSRLMANTIAAPFSTSTATIICYGIEV
jgi:hypothetical protein